MLGHVLLVALHSRLRQERASLDGIFRAAAVRRRLGGNSIDAAHRPDHEHHELAERLAAEPAALVPDADRHLLPVEAAKLGLAIDVGHEVRDRETLIVDRQALHPIRHLKMTDTLVQLAHQLSPPFARPSACSSAMICWKPSLPMPSSTRSRCGPAAFSSSTVVMPAFFSTCSTRVGSSSSLRCSSASAFHHELLAAARSASADNGVAVVVFCSVILTSLG